MDTLYTPKRNSGGRTLSSQDQHSGKWTMEEKEYADALATEFLAGGALEIEEGISLRRFLSQALHCSAKRISKKYEGSDYNGKVLYKKNAKAIPPEEAQKRRANLQELEKKYQESLKVLKMVEDSKQSHRVSSQANTGHGALGRHGLPLSFLQSPGPSTAALCGLVSPANVLGRGAGITHLEVELALQRVAAHSKGASSDSLLQAYIAGQLNTGSRVPGLPLPAIATSGLAARRLLEEDPPADDPTSQKDARASANAASLRSMMGLHSAIGTEGLAPRDASVHHESRLLATNLIEIQQGWRRPQAMLLPNSISSLHTAFANRSPTASISSLLAVPAAGEGLTGEPNTKKAQQNSLILAALRNRKTGIVPRLPEDTAPAAARKRQLEHDDFGMPPSSKFSRLL